MTVFQNILLVFHIIVCVLLIITVLMQQSEGGALGMGGGPSGFMSARGAGNLLTKITWGLFAAFLVLSIALTILGGRERAASKLVGAATPAPAASTPAVPLDPKPLTAPAATLRQQQDPLSLDGFPGAPGETPAPATTPATPPAKQ